MARPKKNNIDPKEQKRKDFIKALENVGYSSVEDVNINDFDIEDLAYDLTEIKVIGREYTVIPVYIDMDFTIYVAQSLYTENNLEPPTYYFFSKYEDEDITRFVAGVKFSEFDKAIRALPDHCHYVDVAVQLKIAKLLTFVAFVRKVPEIEFDVRKPDREKQIDNMYDMLKDLVFGYSDKIHVREVKGFLCYVMTNTDFRTLIGSEHLAIKKALASDKNLITSGNGRYDYKFSQDETSVMCIKVPADDKEEISLYISYVENTEKPEEGILTEADMTEIKEKLANKEKQAVTV